jgi:hypothetical protein
MEDLIYLVVAIGISLLLVKFIKNQLNKEGYKGYLLIIKHVPSKGLFLGNFIGIICLLVFVVNPIIDNVTSNTLFSTEQELDISKKKTTTVNSSSNKCSRSGCNNDKGEWSYYSAEIKNIMFGVGCIGCCQLPYQYQSKSSGSFYCSKECCIGS